MLQNIRNNVQGTMAKVIIAIIIVPFALFGIESLFGGGGPGPVAKVNGKPISELELNNAISLQQRQLIAMMDGQVEPALLDQDRLREPVLQRMIRERLLLDEGRRLGLAVSETAINESIIALPQFQENGRFSVERYQSILRMQGMTPASFKEQLRRELLIQQLLRGVVDSSFVSNRELADIAALLEQTRSFSYAVISSADVAQDLKLDDDELQAYYQANSDAFMRPEQVQVSYINLRLDDFFEPVDEADLRDEYQRMLAQSTTRTQRHAAHIQIEVGAEGEEAALEQAQELYRQLQSGADFAELAREHSADAGSRQTGGDLGVTAGDTFPEEFETALAQLEPGEVSAPVRTDAGYHLIKLLGIDEGEAAPFETVRAELEERLQRHGAEPRLLQAVETLRDLSFNADGLQQPARQLGLELQTSDWIALQGEGEGVLADPRVNAALNSRDVLRERHNSDVIELAPDHFVVVHVDQHRQAELLSFDGVRDRVVELATRQRAEQLAADRAESLMTALRAGQGFSEIAESQGIAWQRAQAIKRNAVEVPEEVLSIAFAQPHPEADQPRVVQARLSSGDALVLAVESVTAGDIQSMDPRQRRALQEQLANNNGQATFAAYLDRVQREAEIERM